MSTHQNCKRDTRFSNILQDCPSRLPCSISKGKTSICMKKSGWIPETLERSFSIKQTNFQMPNILSKEL